MPAKRILVTGGSGKVGHAVIRHLVAEGFAADDTSSNRRAHELLGWKPQFFLQ